MTTRLGRRLSLGLAALYAALGTLEVVLKVAEGAGAATIAFFGGTLLSGAGLIVVGLVSGLSGTARRVCIMLGAAIGFLASAWTIVAPVLAIAVIIANARQPDAPSAGPPPAQR